MTEAEWLAGVNPTPLLEHLEGRVSDRKYRLFVCACCRLIWPWLNDPRSREAIETSERFADGAADALEEAGCTDAQLLGHCRTPAEHVRGCWVLDLVLAKQ